MCCGNHMKHHIVRLVRHPLIAGSIIVFAGSFFSNICNYLFNLLLGRFLFVTDYGTYAVLISFLSLFGIFPSALTTIFAKFTATYKAKEDMLGLSTIFRSGLKIVFSLGLVVLVLLCLTLPYSASFLHIQDPILLILIFLTIFLSIVGSLPTGMLQGEMRLFLLSFYNISTPILKIVIGFVLLLLGWRIFGVTTAIFIASLLSLIFILSLVWPKYRKHVPTGISQALFFKEFKVHSYKFFLATLGITILSTSDILFVKHFFSAEQAGQYAALSLMGRAIFYLASPIYFVFFPLIAQKREKKESIYNTLLLGVGIITLGSVALSFIYFLFPTVILQVFFPAPAYKILASYLGPFSLYIIVFSIAILFNNLLLSLGKSEVYKIDLFVAAIFIVSMYLLHNSFYQVIGILFFTSFLLLSLHLLYYFWSERKEMKSKGI